jgi:hypothetical protein
MASFKDAFRAARAAGKKEFSWNGKSYNTKLKEEVASGPKPRPKAESGPKARPKASPAVAEAAAKSPGGLLPDFKAIRAGNEASQKARRENRDNTRLATDVRKALKDTPGRPKPPLSEGQVAVREKMAKASRMKKGGMVKKDC